MTVPPLITLLHAAMEENSQLCEEAIQSIMDVAETRTVKPGSQNEEAKGEMRMIRRSGSLYDVIKQILSVCPELAKTPEPKAGCLPLHVASSLGDINIVQLILEKFPKAVSSPNKKGKLPIHYAARQGRTEICRFLLNADPKTASFTTSKLKLPLHYAVSEGYEDITHDLLELNPGGIHSVTSKGKVALHFASRWGHTNLMDKLLGMCPNLAQRLDWERQLPIHEAAREGQLEAAKKLIQIYPDGLKQKNIFNELPIFAAVRFGSKELVAEMIRWYPESGKAVLKEAISNDLVHDGDWDILELCLRGAIGALNHELYFAFTTSDVPKCSEIRRNGKNTSTHPCQCFKYVEKSDQGKTPQNFAVELNVINAVRTSKKMKTTSKPEEAVKIVSDFDSDRRHLGYASQHNTSHQKQKGIPQRLFFALHATLECYSSLPIFHRILDSYPNQVVQKDEFGMLPLHIAAYQATDARGVNVFNDILKLNPACAFIPDSMGRLPLHLALLNKADASVVRSLIEINKPSAFAECATEDKFRNSIPLFMATTQYCSLDVVYMLFRGNPASIKMFA